MYNTIDEIRADPMLKHIDKLLFNTNLHGGFIEYEKDNSCFGIPKKKRNFI